MVKSRFPFRPTPQPPDVLQILQDVKQIQNALQVDTAAGLGLLTELSQQIADLKAYLKTRFDAIDAADTQIEADLNPAVPFVPPGQIRSTPDMAILTPPCTINLTAGGTSDGVQFVDSSSPPQIYPGNWISFGPLLGAALPTDVGVTLGSDNQTFTYVAPPTAVTESASVVATATDPSGVQAPVVFPVLNFNITGAAPPPATFVPPGQIDEVSGS